MLSPPPAHPAQPRAGLPSVDRVLAWPGLADALAAHGRTVVLAGVRDELAAQRGLLAAVADGPSPQVPDADMLLSGITHRIQAAVRPTLRPVFNLTGTVLHTNLGRAPLPQQALDAITAVARGAANLEFDLAAGARGDRDDVVAGLLQQLTGAEAATVVNNTAAALVLVLAALAPRREVIVSRGELIEIGGAFRLPDIMRSAGCKLHEVGTTNRTHLRDHAEAIGPRTAMLLKVHTSNYQIQGFSAAVDTADLAPLARAHGLPLVVDLGSGALLDLARWGLPHEPTAAETLAAGADLVLFSGDKLLGGPQAGIIVGRADLVRRLKKHPFKRALRCDKLTLAALEAVLRLYADPDRLAAQLPTLRLLVRPLADIQAQAQRLQPLLAGWLGAAWQVTVADVMSQIGSGALPVDLLPSAALRLQPANMRRGAGRALDALAAGLRALPLPVVGRVADGALWLDLRCLDDEAGFADQLQRATLPGLTAPSAPPAAPVPRAASASTAAPAAPT